MSAILALRPHPPVETVRLGDRAGELELGERRSDRSGVEPGLANERIDARRLAGERHEHPRGAVRERRRRGDCELDPERLEHIGGRGERRRAETQERVRAGRERRGDLTWHGEDLAPGFEREVRGDERAAALASFDDHGCRRQPRDDPVAGREPPRRRLDAGGVLGDDEARLTDPGRELPVRGRVVAIDAAAEHGDRVAGLEGAAMSLAVDPAGEAADDDQPCRGELASEQPRDLRAVGRAGARADDRDGTPAEQFLDAAAAQEQAGRWVVQLSQRRWIRGFAATDEPQPARGKRRTERRFVERATEPVEAMLARLVDDVATGLRRESREDEVAHGVPSSVGERYERASATCSVPTSSAPASKAIVRATRATRARPRAESGSRSTARLSSSFAAVDRVSGSPRARSRAPATRSRTASECSPGAPSSSRARGRGTVTTRSKRSSSARDSLSR